MIFLFSSKQSSLIGEQTESIAPWLGKIIGVAQTIFGAGLRLMDIFPPDKSSSSNELSVAFILYSNNLSAASSSEILVFDFITGKNNPFPASIVTPISGLRDFFILFPSVYLPKYRAEVEENCKAMFKHLGLKDGMMFMQCKVEDGTCYVYDLGFRLTGSLEYKILERVCGYNPLEMMICHALTGKMGFESIADKAIPEFKTPAFNVSCLCAPGTIKEITGIEEVKAFKEVEDVVIAHVPGETIPEKMKGLLAQITVRILGSVETKEQLLPVMQKIDNTIHIIGKQGEELLLPGIEYSDIEGFVLLKAVCS